MADIYVCSNEWDGFRVKLGNSQRRLKNTGDLMTNANPKIRLKVGAQAGNKNSASKARESRTKCTKSVTFRCDPKDFELWESDARAKKISLQALFNARINEVEK